MHYSWFLIFFLVAWSLGDSLFPELHEGWSRSAYWLMGLLGSLFLFLSVLLHELSQSLLATKRGHRVRGITLFMLGGLSKIEDEARGPGEEFWIVVVGPLTSLGLAALFGLTSLVVQGTNEKALALTSYMATVNLLLGLFNLVPGYPMDGGRVLRAVVWRVTGNAHRATQVAATTGMMVGYAMIALGAAMAVLGNLVGGLWLAFVGWFLSNLASSSRRQEATKCRLTGRTVGDAFHREYPIVSPGLTVQQLVDLHMSPGLQRAFRVVDGDALVGIVTVSDVAKMAAEARGWR